MDKMSAESLRVSRRGRLLLPRGIGVEVNERDFGLLRLDRQPPLSLGVGVSELLCRSTAFRDFAGRLFGRGHLVALDGWQRYLRKGLVRDGGAFHSVRFGRPAKIFDTGGARMKSSIRGERSGSCL